MKKFAIIFTISLILTAVLFSCGGGGGGADNAIKEVFTISYNANGAEYGVAPAKQSGDEDSPQAVQANTGNLSKSGYLFDGWNTAADGSGTNYAPGSSYKGKNVTLYAKWAAIFNVQVINPGSPAPALDGVQRAPGEAYIKILSLTAKGRTLSNITIPFMIDGYLVRFIGSGAFQNCDFITELTISDAVTNIENNAFSGCTGLSALTIPSSVTSIGDGALSGCAGLNSLIMLTATPPAMGTGAFEGCTATVSVPVDGLDAYKAAEGWNTYSSSIAGYSTYAYTVWFEDFGATTPTNPSSKEIVPPAVTIGQLPAPPVKTGYNFGRWYKQPDGAGGEFTASTVVTENITVYAKWDEYSYTVSFDGQGATTPASPTSKTVASPNTTVGSLPTEPSKDGFYFGGWNTKTDGTGIVFNGNTTVTSDITVYAVWLNNPTFTVTFDGQGATTAANPSSKQVVSPATTVGELPAPPLKTGYIFGGWYNQPEGAGGEFTASTVVTKNTTVYAKWNNYRYTVTFNGQGADSEPSPSSVTVESPNTTINSLPGELTKAGFYFGGWNTKSDGTGTAFNAETPVTGDITVYAIWLNNPTYTVTFDGQGATTAANPSSKQVISPATTVGSLPTPPLKTGYLFGGWYNQPGGAGGEFTASTVVTENTTVYAKWNNYNYTVTFDGQGATTAANPTSKPVASPATTVGSLPTPPKKTGYAFGGWYNQPGGAGEEFTASTVVTGNTTAYAKWNSYNYTVTFDGQGATTAADPTSKSVASPNTTINALPTPPEKDGFIFDGWYTQPGGAGNQFTNETVVEGNITVYAKWIAIFTYNIGNTITITGLTAEGSQLSYIAIPTTLDGKAVSDIGGSAFYDCTGLTDITIPTGVASIGQYAFNGCTGLTSITIPTSVTSIGNNAFNSCTNLSTVNFNATNCTTMGSSGLPVFSRCSKLSTVNIGDNVKKIPSCAFYDCTGLARINIQNNVTSIGQSAFSGCSNLTGITIPTGITSIEQSVFYGCIRLTNITIPTGVTSIGESAFCGCTGLTSITIPTSVTSIGNNAFKNCTKINTVNFNATNCSSMGNTSNPAFSGCSISTVNIGVNVKKIPSCAFYGCTGLASITIPESVISIGGSAFYGCTKFTSITIPDNVTSIGSNAFYGCSGLTSATLGDSITSIGTNAFRNCSNLTTVNFNAENCTNMGNNSNPVFDRCSKLSTLNIGNNVINIPPYAFYGCTSLTSITIPGHVTNIGICAFYGCTGITNISLSNSVTSIEQSAFYGCTGFTDITIPSSVVSIGDYAFNRCSSLTNITIPDSVTSVGEKLFDGCTNLKSITIPQAVVDNSNALLFLSYQNADMGTNVSVTLSNNVTSIGAKAFFEYHGLVNVTIPESVISIGAGAFYRTNLRNITIPSGVTKINASTFWECSPLTEVTFKGTIPPTYDLTSYNNHQDLGKYPFENCSNLITIKVPAESVEAYKTASYWDHYAALIVADE